MNAVYALGYGLSKTTKEWVPHDLDICSYGLDDNEKVRDMKGIKICLPLLSIYNRTYYKIKSNPISSIQYKHVTMKKEKNVHRGHL